MGTASKFKKETAISNEKMKAVPKGKVHLARVTLLDGSSVEVPIDKKTVGQALLDHVADNLGLVEKDYFGLLFSDHSDSRNWLQLDKRVRKQLKGEPLEFRFSVKFYPLDPSQLQEDVTRYQLCLQIRHDVMTARLPCSFVTHALLGSYLAQAECGDYEPQLHCDTSYLAQYQLAPTQTAELLEKVAQLHKTLRGQTPAEAELHYLENAKKLAMYGVDLHPAKDSEGVDIMLGICASGLMVYRDKLRINRFAWPKILKISYKRNHFYVKIRPGEFERHLTTVGFKLASYGKAKRLWKHCVEHHTFFRLMSPDVPSSSGELLRLPRLGSRFRYSGRTQYQTRMQTLAGEGRRSAPGDGFRRALSGRALTTRSMDPLTQSMRSRDRNDTLSYDPDHAALSSPVRLAPSLSTGSPGSGRTLDSQPDKQQQQQQQQQQLRRPVGGVAVLPPIDIASRRARAADESVVSGCVEPVAVSSLNSSVNSATNGTAHLYDREPARLGGGPVEARGGLTHRLDGSQRDATVGRFAGTAASPNGAADASTVMPAAGDGAAARLGTLASLEKEPARPAASSVAAAVNSAALGNYDREPARWGSASPGDFKKAGQLGSYEKEPSRLIASPSIEAKVPSTSIGGAAGFRGKLSISNSNANTASKSRQLTPTSSVEIGAASSAHSARSVSHPANPSPALSPPAGSPDNCAPLSLYEREPARLGSGGAAGGAAGGGSGGSSSLRQAAPANYSHIGSERSAFDRYQPPTGAGSADTSPAGPAPGATSPSAARVLANTAATLGSPEHHSHQQQQPGSASSFQRQSRPGSGFFARFGRKKETVSAAGGDDNHEGSPSSVLLQSPTAAAQTANKHTAGVSDKPVKDGPSARHPPAVQHTDLDSTMESEEVAALTGAAKKKRPSKKNSTNKSKSAGSRSGAKRAVGAKTAVSSPSSSSDSTSSSCSSSSSSSSSVSESESDMEVYGVEARPRSGQPPAAVTKTTTRTTLVTDDAGTRQHTLTAVEDLQAGTLVLEQSHTKRDRDEAAPHVMATTVTTRTAQLHENASQPDTNWGQMKEKTFSATTTTSATHQEQTVLTQEVQKTRKLIGPAHLSALAGSGDSPLKNTAATVSTPTAATGSPSSSQPVCTRSPIGGYAGAYRARAHTSQSAAASSRPVPPPKPQSFVAGRSLAGRDSGAATDAARQQLGTYSFGLGGAPARVPRAVTVASNPGGQLAGDSAGSASESASPANGLTDSAAAAACPRPSGRAANSATPNSTESHRVCVRSDDFEGEAEIVSSQTVTSKQRTVETVTYKTEKDGVVETRVEQKITIQSDGDPIDHDAALRDAIQEATDMNPDMTVEKIEIQQQQQQQQHSAR